MASKKIDPLKAAHLKPFGNRMPTPSPKANPVPSKMFSYLARPSVPEICFAGSCQQLWALVKYDAIIGLRRKHSFLSVLLFCTLTLLLLRFALPSAGVGQWRLTPHVLVQTQAKGMLPDHALALQAMLNRPFATRQAFVQALQQHVGKPQLRGKVLLAVMQAVKASRNAPLSAGLLWVALLLGGTLSLNRAFEQEREQGILDVLLLTPASRWVLYVGKMLACLLRLLVLQACLLPLTALFFGSNLGHGWLILLPTLLGGALGIAALGALLGWLAAEIPGRDMLLPILLYPLLTPLLLAVVQLTTGALQGLPWHVQWPWLRLMLAFDAMMLIAAWLLFEHTSQG